MIIRDRKKETLIYMCIWLTVAVLYIFDHMRNRSELGLPIFDFSLLGRMILAFLPYMLIFAVNNYLLIPKLLLKDKLKKYSFSVLALLALSIGYEFIRFDIGKGAMPLDKPERHAPYRMRKPAKEPRAQVPFHKKPLPPLPFLLDFINALLVVGGNLAIALIFQRYHDTLEKESQRKADAESRLTYLKAQINPHFYMNMLNNIHGMIEINPSKAQAMVLNMSRLMRYMLYDSSKPLIPLNLEIDFLKNYIEIMKMRYDDRKVTISYDFPGMDETSHVLIHPLLFLVFIENAFKHGISYRNNSFISIRIDMTQEDVRFQCLNSNVKSNDLNQSGIGLSNVRQRLKLLYGDRAVLGIENLPNAFTVNLTIPYNEDKDINN